MSNSDDTLELFSAQVCPFAHRSRLVLAEKHAEFTLTEIDLKNKPDTFKKISRYGKVPALVHRGHALVESTIINQYLDDILPHPPMVPNDPSLKARMRIWIDYFDRFYLDFFYGVLTNQDRSKDTEFKANIEQCLHVLENDSLTERSGNGPYWLGRTPTLIDYTFYPFFERFDALRVLRGINIPDDCINLKSWIELMSNRPSVMAIANPPEFYVERYKNYGKK